MKIQKGNAVLDVDEFDHGRVKIEFRIICNPETAAVTEKILKDIIDHYERHEVNARSRPF